MANLSLSLWSLLPNLCPVLPPFFFKKDLWLSADKQTLPHSGYHFILLDIGIFQTRSKACREEPGLNYGLRNIRRLLLCHLLRLVFVCIFHLNYSKYSIALSRGQCLISQVLCVATQLKSTYALWVKYTVNPDDEPAFSTIAKEHGPNSCVGHHSCKFDSTPSVPFLLACLSSMRSPACFLNVTTHYTFSPPPAVSSTSRQHSTARLSTRSSACLTKNYLAVSTIDCPLPATADEGNPPSLLGTSVILPELLFKLDNLAFKFSEEQWEGPLSRWFWSKCVCGVGGGLCIER